MDAEIAPIHRLPPELLIIFLWAWTLAEPLYFPRHGVQHRTDLLLVCRQWTSLLLGTPNFWTDISVTPAAYRHAYIQSVLTRSAARHLSVRFYVSPVAPYSSYPAALQSNLRYISVTFGAFFMITLVVYVV
ncbi:hypothetical protein C8R45DRAFT_1089008 [Mycena sanguinolenta]|nr:hypothetical protein C8R45DRAFT_1089008 [Mycena sanguinolenta]